MVDELSDGKKKKLRVSQLTYKNFLAQCEEIDQNNQVTPHLLAPKLEPSEYSRLKPSQDESNTYSLPPPSSTSQ